MRAVGVREFGGPEVLVPRELPDPEPGPGEAVVEVAAADVLFLDTMIRSGRVREAFPQRPPYVPGNGVAGYVAGGDPAWGAGRSSRVPVPTGAQELMPNG
jgi:NADPH:quinone reductase